MRAKLSLALCTSAVFLLGASAHAQDRPGVITTGTTTASVEGSTASRSVNVTPGRHEPRWQQDGSWGWFVVATSVFVGAGITGFGLGQTCPDPEPVNACTKGTSLALWAGIGIVAVGTAIGVLIVQEGHARTKHLDLARATVKLGPLGEFRFASPLPTPH